MKLEEINIQNFKGIEDLSLKLHPEFNLFIGENGSGKTAILEAFAVGIGCFFSGIPGIQSRHIRNGDIRYFKSIEGSYEYAASTKIEVLKAEFHREKIHWFKERNGILGSNIMGNRSQIRILADQINRDIRNSKRTLTIDLPVLGYYSTARLWKEGRENKKEEKSESSYRNLPSRYRGYKDALEIKSTFKIMLEWFKSKFKDMIMEGESSFQLECVKSSIIKNIPGAINVKWIFDKDKIQTLYIVFKDKSEIPFHYLSDGYRNLLAIFADLAYRCVTLNPHFGIEANIKTEGIVLIDELDLHLHPAWQKTIVKQLRETFPKIQFITTTHSPFIIQETNEGELFKIQNNGKINVGGANEYSLEDIAEYLQNVENPSWSTNKKEMYDAAKEYFELLENMSISKSQPELDKIRERLNILGKAYSTNVAYTAFLEQKRFIAEEKLKK